LAHWIAINDTRMLIEQAVEKLPVIKLVQWITEWETINKDASTTDQFCLHIQLNENPPLSCSPDAGFLIEYQNQRMVYYLEKDLGTSGPKQIAARKSKGYAELSRRELHRKHFPATTRSNFRVLFVTTADSRAKAVHQELKNRPGRDLWLTINEKNITADNFFTGAIAIDQQGESGPLLNIPHSAPQKEAAPTTTVT
jgi:hypothetical protein